MSTLQTKTLADLVSGMVAAIQAAATKLLGLTIGSVLLAIVEAWGGVLLWLQALILQVQTTTRAATSVGTDLDSFMADYGLFRLPALAATGAVTFSRSTTTNLATLAVGATVETADGSQSYAVTIDITNTAYNATLNAYVINIGSSGVTVPVQALTAGAGGNVLAGTINTITQATPGIDTATNANPLTNGIDAETDEAFRARFVLYIAALSKGTKAAVKSAVANIQQNLQSIIIENYDYNGTYDPGFFYVVVDDGSGNPSSTLIDTIHGAVETVRALSIRFAIFAPVVVTANVALTITSMAGYDHAVVVGNVGIALRAFINTLPLGADLPWTQIAAVAYGVPGVANVSAVLLNSGTSDLVATDKQVIKSGTVTVA